MTIGILISDMTRRAGTERAVANLAAILAHSGHSAAICSAYSSGGAPAYELPPGVRLLHGGLSFTAGESLCRKLRRKTAFISWLRSLKFDVLIGTETSFNILLPLSCAKLTIGCEHMNYGFAPAHLRLLRRIVYRRLDATVLLTAGDARKYTFVPPAKLAVIPNSLPFDLPPAAAHDGKELLAVGRLTRQKGFDMLLTAAVKVRERHPDWHLTIVGGGEDREALERQIAASGLSEFVTLKPPTPDIQLYYRRAGIYVMSSRWEGFPMVLLEAQAFGLPVVSFDCPEGPADIVADGRNGFLVPADDVSQLAERINELIEHPDRRTAFSSAAAANAAGYTEAAVAPQWAALLTALTGGKDPAEV